MTPFKRTVLYSCSRKLRIALPAATLVLFSFGIWAMISNSDLALVAALHGPEA